MAEYLAPGVYIEETSFRSKVIEGVSTTTTGFIGPCRYGPVTETPDIITGIGEFERRYGNGQALAFVNGPTLHNYLWHAARAFFTEGGKRLYISRVFRPLTLKEDGTDETDPAKEELPYAPPSATLQNDKVRKGSTGKSKDLYADGHARAWLPTAPKSEKEETLNKILIRARYPGSPGNNKVRLTVQLGQNLLGRKQDPDDPSKTVNTLGAASNLDFLWISHEGTPGAGKPPVGFYSYSFDETTSKWTLHRKNENAEEPFELAKFDSDYSIRLITLTVETLSSSGLATYSQSNLALHPAHTTGGSPDSLFSSFEATDVDTPVVILGGGGLDTALEVLQAIFPDAIAKPVEPGPVEPGPVEPGPVEPGPVEPGPVEPGPVEPGPVEPGPVEPGPVEPGPVEPGPVEPEEPSATSSFGKLEAALEAGDFYSFEVQLSGGHDGLEPGPSEYEGTENPDLPYKTGLRQFEDIEDISIVAAPCIMGGYRAKDNVGRAAPDTVNNLLINHAQRMRYRIAVLDSGEGQTISDVRKMRAKMDSKYAALYYPWIKILDPITRKEIALPPSGFVAGIYARNDVNRAVYKAPANEVVNLALGFELFLNKSQQDVLNPEGINCFRFFEGRGMLLWGARTISSDSEWKYVNLRRYFAYVERSIEKGTQWAVFEPNGFNLWNNVRYTITDFLLNEWSTGALLGEKPDKAFFVRCDRSTMTQNDIDNGRLVCLIGMAVVRPAEFVIFRIGQWTADRKV